MSCYIAVVSRVHSILQSPGLTWQPYIRTEPIPTNTLLTHINPNIYVIRIFYEGNVYPAFLNSQGIFAIHNEEMAISTIQDGELAILESPYHYEWVSQSAGDFLPDNAVIGGRPCTSEPLTLTLTLYYSVGNFLSGHAVIGGRPFIKYTCCMHRQNCRPSVNILLF